MAGDAADIEMRACGKFTAERWDVILPVLSGQSSPWDAHVFGCRGSGDCLHAADQPCCQEPKTTQPVFRLVIAPLNAPRTVVKILRPAAALKVDFNASNPEKDQYEFWNRIFRIVQRGRSMPMVQPVRVVGCGHPAAQQAHEALDQGQPDAGPPARRSPHFQRGKVVEDLFHIRAGCPARCRPPRPAPAPLLAQADGDRLHCRGGAELDAVFDQVDQDLDHDLPS